MKNEATKLMEPVSVRKNEFFSERLVVEPNEATRFTMRPLNIEVASPMESASDLRNEFLLANPDDELRVALRLFARPLA